MDKTAQTERYRLFLVDALPEPVTTASQHLQIFDGYIMNTRLRIRRLRDPYKKVWSMILQQRFRTGPDTAKVAEIHLNDREFAAMERLPSSEIRKNRYFHEFDGRVYAFDVYLGALQGLVTAKVELHAGDDEFEMPSFAKIDVTSDEQFDGDRLVNSDMATVMSSIQR